MRITLATIFFTLLGSCASSEEEQIQFNTWLEPQSEPIEQKYFCRDGIQISDQFTASERLLINEAFQYVNEFIASPGLVHEGTGRCHLFPFDQVIDNHGGYCQSDGQIAIIHFKEMGNYCAEYGNFLGDCWRAIVMHELMHSTGEGHLPQEERGIQTPIITSLSFTDDDRNLCRAVQVCR